MEHLLFETIIIILLFVFAFITIRGVLKLRAQGW